MNLFSNRVTLRGFLGRDADVPTSGRIQDNSFAVLLLATVSGSWDPGANEWSSRIDWHRVICPGPYFCGFTRGMRRGDYLEIEGELRAHERERSVVAADERLPVSCASYAVHATHIRRLERPLAVIDTEEGG